MPRNTASRFFTGACASLPGLILCSAVTLFSYGLEAGERALFGRAWLEALVLAILSGAIVRSIWKPGPRWDAGMAFSSGFLLELSVCLLGASVRAADLLAMGPLLIGAVAIVVVGALGAGYGIGRMLGLSSRMALLVACGNAICGNSAIAAVAPVIRANAKDIAASVSFTAVFGIAVVITLPVLGQAFQMTDVRFGAFSGMTVYAVPQVLAATVCMGSTAVQTGTVIKLVRVLMLGPVCFMLSLLVSRLPDGPAENTGVKVGERLQYAGLFSFVPWFIIGFIVLAACRSFGLLPSWFFHTVSPAATIMTVVSMGALGLSVDIRAVASAGRRVAASVILSLLCLGVFSYGALTLLHVG
ncbi:YeiH family protein [Gluconobacter kanchanaburiensis]|uniref:UPF0324 membrane protein n=1 Tax=Gluconobacter kanchanaburiensis NBRC 103587 TaxID=1307948 RepID=A0A511BA14_9PROT|nr:putative sulfate exporter family transporter [Gluconobacter kanchanaburiensis]MBF0862939.1 putative sulfate exporter family transporter [Gluconobacter kanchanaburiensis]GBR69116.1 hypothetical protein AA103587_1149 [Gluconobacter kanchanaburiensis NBRC 103587]GEK97265.1 UPF0324 membrane protein [Gluconobacter kanchanaburiensis NBRC 103587]